jgi:tetratricopeptide (TPR) repeat protein
MPLDEDRQPQVQQNVMAVSGFAYGVIGADLHVFRDKGPVYSLREWRTPSRAAIGWLLAQPSRLLDPHSAVVGFTGREYVLARLAEWRDTATSRLSALVLHGPGGQGKTRLADEFARQTALAGWKVVSVAHAAGSVLSSPCSNDMRLGNATGLLVLIDYADRWPLSHLSWLFSNSLLQQRVPTRLLLSARTAHQLPMLRAMLADQQVDVVGQRLEPLTAESGERDRMFTAACTAFARCYGLKDLTVVPPASLSDHADFGLTLAIQMAALASVDAAAHGLRPPAGMAGLSAYLLDRERRHWTMLYENRADGVEFGTPPSVMARAVFTASIAGPVSRQDGRALLGRLDLGVRNERLFADHATCYLPISQELRDVLQPLRPDLLAEDFIALTLPGHDADGHPADSWAASALPSILASGRDPAATYLPHALSALTAAAARWPHVGTGHLFPLLRRDPDLALQGGSAALTALAELPAIPDDLLGAIDARLPAGASTDLDLGIAALAQRVAARRLAKTTEPGDQAAIYHTLAERQFNAGEHDDACATQNNAVTIWEHLAQADPGAFEPALAASLSHLGAFLAAAGHRQEAVQPAAQAATIRRRLAAARPGEYDAAFATSMTNLAVALSGAGRHREAARAARQALPARRRLAAADPAFAPGLAASLDNLGVILWELRRYRRAMAASREAVAIYRRVVAAGPGSFDRYLAKSLSNLGVRLWTARQHHEALKVTEDAIQIQQRLAAANPAAFEADLAASTDNLGIILAELKQYEQALDVTREAVTMYQRLTEAAPAAAEPAYATALNNLTARLCQVQRYEEALGPGREAVAIRRRLADVSPPAFGRDLIHSLTVLSEVLTILGLRSEAAAAQLEAAKMRQRIRSPGP